MPSDAVRDLIKSHKLDVVTKDGEAKKCSCSTGMTRTAPGEWRYLSRNRTHGRQNPPVKQSFSEKAAKVFNEIGLVARSGVGRPRSTTV